MIPIRLASVALSLSVLALAAPSTQVQELCAGCWVVNSGFTMISWNGVSLDVANDVKKGKCIGEACEQLRGCRIGGAATVSGLPSGVGGTLSDQAKEWRGETEPSEWTPDENGPQTVSNGDAGYQARYVTCGVQYRVQFQLDVPEFGGQPAGKAYTEFSGICTGCPQPQ